MKLDLIERIPVTLTSGRKESVGNGVDKVELAASPVDHRRGQNASVGRNGKRRGWRNRKGAVPKQTAVGAGISLLIRVIGVNNVLIGEGVDDSPALQPDPHASPVKKLRRQVPAHAAPETQGHPRPPPLLPARTTPFL